MKKITITNLVSLMIVAVMFVVTTGILDLYESSTKASVENKISSSVLEKEEVVPEVEEEVKPEPEIIYDGHTREELITKLNNVLHSNLAGTGESFLNYSQELGVDLYVAVAIVLQETGCYWNCSAMVRDCNNIGGMKGYGDYSCWGGSYAGFNTLDAGISRYMHNLYNTYTSRGLITPEQMNSVYAEDPLWASRVNNYINIISKA